jgi:hypothetical protein
VKRKTTVTGYQALTPFTLYLPDVQDLVAVVASVSTSVAVETDEYTGITTLDELAEGLQGPTRRVKEIHLIGRKRGVPRIRVSVTEHQGLVVLESGASDLIGAQEKIKRIMWRHTDALALASLWPFLMFLLLFLAAMAILSSELLSAVSFAVGAASLGVVGWWLGKTRFARVYLVDQAQAPGLLARNRDVLLMLAGVVLGLLAPLMIAWVRSTPQ